MTKSREVLSRPPITDLDLMNMRQEVTIEDSTGYFLRVITDNEFGRIIARGGMSNERWFMMVHHRIPPQAVNWMLGNALGKAVPFKHCVLLTPKIVEECHIRIFEQDSPTIDLWYPAVQLNIYPSVPLAGLKDATGLVNQRMAGLNSSSSQLDILRAVNTPISIQELELCPPFSAGVL